MQTTAVKQTIDTRLRDMGFVRKGSCWYLDTAETIVLVDLQASNYAKSFYVNLAAFLKDLGSEKFPKEHKCPVRVRLTSFYPEQRERIETAFDLEKTVADDSRQSEIEAITQELILPIAAKFSSFKRIKAAWESGDLKAALISQAAQELLSLSK